MGTDIEKKADDLLDEKQDEEEKENEENGQDEEKKPPINPGEALREISRGKLKLLQPFRARSQDVTEIHFDFCSLTNEEMMDALDSVPVNNILAITNQQAMALFAATAGKCAPYAEDEGSRTKLYDAKDVRKRLGPADAVKAVQIAKLFYSASSQAGNNNISKE